MVYQLQISKKSRKFLASLDFKLAERIGIAVRKLAENPHPPGSLKLTESEDSYRIRVGDYRVIYQIQETVLVVFVIRFGHRKDTYR